ncbi:MAG TPA: serine/threonine-protein kinase, partial [Ktedonobacterales bacterium]
MAGMEGRTLGGYQLGKQIGAGAITEVFRAQPTTGGRETAVRIIHPEFAAQPGVRERHQRATAAGSRLSQHAHILPLAGHGEDGPHLYLASPFVAEGTLNDWLHRGGRLGVADIGPFFKQLANAVTYAHSTGVVHGNLKPANIFLFEGRHVLLGDFGMLWDPTQVDMHRPGPGSQAAEWLAPEAFNGRFSQATDIYALGIVLFALITGRTPFRGTTPAEVFEGHAHQPVPPLLKFDSSLSPQFREFDAVLGQALAKRQEERFASAALLAQAIERAAQAAPQGGGWQQAAANPFGGPRNAFPAQPMPGLGAPGPSPFPMSPGAMPGMQQAAPLNPMPMPSTELGGLMEEGGISFNWNEALPRPEMAQRPAPAPRPEPVDERTVRMPAPQPQFAPPMPTPMPFPGPSGGQGYITGGAGGMPIPSAPPMMAPPNAFPQPDLAPLPSEAPRDQKGFSSQELGLPRLTYADLGDGLSKDLEEQMRAEAGGSSLQIMIAGEAEPRTYSARAKAPRHDEPEDSMSLSAVQPSARPRREMSRDFSEEMSAQMSAPVRSHKPSRRHDDYSEEMASVEMPRRR